VSYNLHDENSINIKSNGAEKRLSGLKKFFERYPSVSSKISNNDKKRLLSNTLFNVAQHHIYHERKIKALFFLLRSIASDLGHEQNKHKFLCILKIINCSRILEYQNKKSI
jgi:hypothetical protein